MKVLILSCSNRRMENSLSYKIAQKIMELFKERESDVEIVSLADYDIRLCEGCEQCFLTGKCIINDGLNIVKKKLKDMEHVIFIVPVYAHNVPSVLKNFIDRTSYWLHIFGMLGKSSSTITVSSSNGNVYVMDYMKKILEYYGTIYLGNIDITVDMPNMLEEKELLHIILNKHIENILEFEKKHIDELSLIETQSGLFLNYKKIYDKPNDSYEANIWQTDTCLQKNSFWEAYDEKIRSRMIE